MPVIFLVHGLSSSPTHFCVDITVLFYVLFCFILFFSLEIHSRENLDAVVAFFRSLRTRAKKKKKGYIDVLTL